MNTGKTNAEDVLRMLRLQDNHVIQQRTWEALRRPQRDPQNLHNEASPNTTKEKS